jgi:membrane fusion protein, copper/silver efflux system
VNAYTSDGPSAGPRGRRARRVAAAVVLVATLALAWWLVARRDDRGAAATGDQRGMPGMPGMSGMPGMNMGADGTVTLTAAQLRQFGVTFGTVEARTLESAVRATGTVTIDETRVVRVSPKVSGWVERVHADFTGQPVRRGQALVELYAPDLLAAQEELLLAARLDRQTDESSVPGMPAGAGDVLGAARRRLRLLDVPDAQIDEVLRTGRPRRTVTIVAPASGVVVEKLVAQGQAVSAGAPMYTIADLSRVWVDVEVRESDAGVLRPGVGADIEMAGQPGRPYKGRVEFVYPTLDAATRTVRARVSVANAGGALRPGAYATVRITAPARRALTVPASAVVNTGERSLVFVDMGGGQLMPHEVEIGRVAGDYAEVLAGVEPGQRVVTSAQYLLESESNLADVMRAMMGQGGAGDMSDMPGMSMPGMSMPGTSTHDTKGADTRGTSRPVTP